MTSCGPLVRAGLGAWLVSVAIGATGCPKKKDDAQAKSDEGKVEAKADEAGEAKTQDDGAAADETAGAAADTGSAAAGSTGAAKAEGDGAAASTGAAAPNPAELLEQAERKRTKDDAAMELLAKAEEAGAEPAALAAAAVKRGERLHATPDRAAKFFEWAAEKDPTAPEPVWHLAKQAATQGDVPKTKELLRQVKERKGKKLLQQIDFDPMWEIVKDDPEVRALLR